MIARVLIRWSGERDVVCVCLCVPNGGFIFGIYMCWFLVLEKVKLVFLNGVVCLEKAKSVVLLGSRAISSFSIEKENEGSCKELRRTSGNYGKPTTFLKD